VWYCAVDKIRNRELSPLFCGFHSNAIACVACVSKHLRWQAANHGCYCFDRAFLLAGACVCCVRMETGLKCTSIHYSVTSWLRHAYNAKIIIILAGRKESCAILAVYLVCYRLLVACVVSDAQQIRRMSVYCTRSALHIGMMVLHNDIPVQE